MIGDLYKNLYANLVKVTSKMKKIFGLWYVVTSLRLLFFGSSIFFFLIQTLTGLF